MKNNLSVLALAAATVILALVAIPAQATPSGVDGGTWIVKSQTLYDDCYDIDVNYRVALPSAVETYFVESKIIGPDGDTTSDFSDGDGNVGTGTTTVFVCGSGSEIGTYLVSGTIEAYDADYNRTSYTMPDASFSLRAPATRTYLSLSDTTVGYNDRVAFRVKATGDTVRGFRPLDYTTVRLQFKDGNKWRSFRHGGNKATTNGAGVFKNAWAVNFRRNVKVRALTLGDGIFRPSKTKATTIKVRG